MRQAILYSAGDLRLEERLLNIDGVLPDQALVQTEVTALSTGTDLGNYLGDSLHVPGAPPYPRTIGYSNVGIVQRTGAEFSGPETGERVFSMKPHQSAFITGPNELLVQIPHSVSSEQASLAYLTQLGLAALRRARYEAGENVVVVGLGVIGLCTLALARVMGAHVIGIGNSPVRTAAALNVGAHAAYERSDRELASRVKAEFCGSGADIVVLTANTWDSWRLSMELVRYAGRASVLGFPGRAQSPPPFNPLDPAWLYGKQLTILGAGWSPQVECSPAEIRFNLRRNLEYILKLMATGQLSIEPLISHRLPAERMVEAYELAKQHNKDLIAAIFDWRQE